MGAEREMTLAEWVGSLGQPQHRAHREYVELLATLDAERKRAEEAERGLEIAREELGRMRDWRDKERTRAADAEQREKAGWARVDELTTTLDAARKRAEAAEAALDEAEVRAILVEQALHHAIQLGRRGDVYRDRAEVERDEALALLREAKEMLGDNHSKTEEEYDEWSTLDDRIDALLAKHEGESRG